MIPVASSFLAGSLLSLLLPVALLIGLVIWHFRVVVRAERPGRMPEQTQVPVTAEQVTEPAERRP
jgi:hypothetical protein